MKTARTLIIAGLAGIALLASAASQARVNWNIDIGVLPPPVVYAPPPVVYAPPAPVVVEPYYDYQPRYYREPRVWVPAPPPRHYWGHDGGRHEHHWDRDRHWGHDGYRR